MTREEYFDFIKKHTAYDVGMALRSVIKGVDYVGCTKKSLREEFTEGGSAPLQDNPRRAHERIVVEKLEAFSAKAFAELLDTREKQKQRRSEYFAAARTKSEQQDVFVGAERPMDERWAIDPDGEFVYIVKLSPKDPGRVFPAPYLAKLWLWWHFQDNKEKYIHGRYVAPEHAARAYRSFAHEILDRDPHIPVHKHDHPSRPANGQPFKPRMTDCVDDFLALMKKYHIDAPYIQIEPVLRRATLFDLAQANKTKET